MTEQAGYMNQPDLIEEVAQAIAYTDGWREPWNWHELQRNVYVMRANAALDVLRRRGLITEQGLELIKQSGEAK